MPTTLAYDSKHALNAICPYFTMFPLEYPFRILQKHKKETPIVFDPFSGRGTTLYAARAKSLDSWGLDTSPVAVSVAKAKLASAELDEVISLAENLIGKGGGSLPNTPFFTWAYSNKVLTDIISLREGLNNLQFETNASVILRAAILGCLHGPLSKHTENASYFSNQMPRTFSSKPEYSIKYWEARNLNPPNVNVVDVLRRKLSRINKLNSETKGKFEQVFCDDARNPLAYDKLPPNISLVITSPPYYGMRTYLQDQWLRLWFLGGPEIINYQTDIQLNHNGTDNFIQDLALVWKNIATSQAENLHLYIRFGTVPSVKSDARKIVNASLDAAGGWKLISIRNAKSSHSGNRQAEQMTKKSKAADEYDFHAVRR